MKTENESPEALCTGTVKIIASGETSSFEEYADKLLEEMNRKLVKLKKSPLSIKAKIDYEESEFKRIFIIDGSIEYVIRTWDVIGIKNGAKVRYTFFKY